LVEGKADAVDLGKEAARLDCDRGFGDLGPKRRDEHREKEDEE
jgi:hypothetical protein